MKKYITLVIFNVIMVVCAAKLLFSQNNENHTLAYRFTFVSPLIWDETANGITVADEELGTNTKCIGFKSMNEQGQVDAIQKAIYSKVNGIITAGTNSSPELIEVINAAVKEEIPVVLVNSDIPSSDRTCYVGTDNYEAGRMAGEDMAEATGKKAKIGVIVSKM